MPGGSNSRGSPRGLPGMPSTHSVVSCARVFSRPSWYRPRGPMCCSKNVGFTTTTFFVGASKPAPNEASGATSASSGPIASSPREPRLSLSLTAIGAGASPEPPEGCRRSIATTPSARRRVENDRARVCGSAGSMRPESSFTTR